MGQQYEFVPFMLQGPAYNCSAYMPPGEQWAVKFGVQQIPFGIYSLVFGIITEILYIPCMIGLGRDLSSSCIKIILAIVDMVATMAVSVLFGWLLIQGAVFCSNPVMAAGIGIVGYSCWIIASTVCLVLGLNRLFELLNLSQYFSSSRTLIYIGICLAYGLFMTLFTRPLIFNSAYQSMFFSVFIPGHSTSEYENLPHVIHDVVVVSFTFLLYGTLCVVLVVKTTKTSGSNTRIIKNTPVFFQAMMICSMNLISSIAYVSMSFTTVPDYLIIVGHVAWQLSHGSPPFIYFALNKSIRHLALKALGLGHFIRGGRVTKISTTNGSSGMATNNSC